MNTKFIQSARRSIVGIPTFLRELASFVAFAVRRFYGDQLGQSAGALTYSTLLALVPLMVLTLAILSGFPAFDAVRDRMEELFFTAVVPEVGIEIQQYLTRFSANASNLTAVGIAALAVAAVLLLWTIEATLNQVWRVERPRPIGVRLLIYWTVLTLGPLLLAIGFAPTNGVLATAIRYAETGVGTDTLDVPSSALHVIFPLLGQSLTFMLLYKLVPARPVRLQHAALGGAIAGIAFQILRWGFNSFLTSGSTYETIYGALAVLPIFLVWVYSSWTVIIFGAVFAASFPDWWQTRDPDPGRDLTPAGRLEVAVVVLGVLFRHSEKGGTVALSEVQDAAPIDLRDPIIECLVDRGYIVTTETSCLSLSRDLYRATVADLARDLELSLGALPPETVPGAHEDRAMARIAGSSGSLPDLLKQLFQAENTILARPLAEVIQARAVEATPLARSSA
ncbi:YihY family inner membrane protein [Tranquillimonas alkanivorans]|uniref:UPF0761 membrane protein SAMN04488047_108150 n=1 Tax=Tranquillimonas alkanivorans TaxID=441119 RepID=A0A1I5RFD3_9RHOB|nr:YihY family inner membrane protein [Tranquillimonas alkanivorans]SFP57264.1 tRNA-processing RNAse BN [Tranquillimonas alkanivorans]